MLEILKSSLELIKNKSNPELIKATEKMFERRKTQVVNSPRILPRLLDSKAGNIVFDKIARNYIDSFNFNKIDSGK
ncbi:MAG: hypothetical protein LBN19_03470 [Endomicrobium sp.]|nr:hypothetical protein [Endomicrobium sp.]